MTQQELLERLAERGEPVGADRMIERIEAELAGAPLVRVGEQTLESPHRTHRPVVVAVVAALVVGALGIGSWLIGPILPPDVQVPPDDPLELATGDGLWPTVDMVGTPESIAIAFAESVLGWAEASARIDRTGVCFAVPLWQGRGETCGEEATAVVVSAPARDTIEVVAGPIGRTSEGRLWMVEHVGDGYPVDMVGEAPEFGSRLTLPTVSGAVSADIALHAATDLDDVVHLSADRGDLAAGFLDTRAVANPRQILAVLVRYRDSDGGVITAIGGPRNSTYPWDTDEPVAAGPDVVLSEGTYRGSDRPWTLVGHVTEDGGFCMGFTSADNCQDMPLDSTTPAIGRVQSSSGEDGPWCVSGSVTQGSRVELRFETGPDVSTEVVKHPDFPISVYAYCAADGPPPVATAAIDADGNVLTVVEGGRRFDR